MFSGYKELENLIGLILSKNTTFYNGYKRKMEKVRLSVNKLI